MGKIKELTKNTLFQLKEENLPTTPENYFIEFKNQAQHANIEIAEFELFNKIKKVLTLHEIETLEIKTFNHLAVVLANRVNENELKKLIEIFEEILKPFSDSDLSNEIKEFILKILETPKNIILDESINTLKEIANKRVDSDRKILKDKTSDIIKLTSLMSRYFDKTLNESENSSEDILKIKNELITLDMSEASQRELKVVQTKLVDTIHKIENSIKLNCKIINDHKVQFNSLNEQIKKLEEELIIAREEKQTDFLTNVFNRRAYHDEIDKIEKNYSIFNNNYAIIFYDIDHFKKINDNYGHTCGDAVLKNFASILKKLTRAEDVIARYGGEEFIALINYEKEEEVQGYIKRVKNTINSTNFIYKEESIHIKFSAGVTYRNNYDSYLDAKKRADELLYEAKSKGRDRIIFDDQIEI
ncbi:GGDEF domain-containing protein [Arcobacter sp. s6]|uniref:GGDEF domain-containing protein n=1 Tax=Arcobacter sp. s6 TaxID=3230363 RepID=UPI0034A00422